LDFPLTQCTTIYPFVSGSFSFREPRPVRLFPPPETGEGEGGGEDQRCVQAVLLPPFQPFPATASAEGRLIKGGPSPARGEGVKGPGQRGEHREMNGPAFCLYEMPILW
jgi:hypothetical protein